MCSFISISKYILQIPCVFITPPSSFSLSKSSTTQNSKNTKRRILLILNINLCSKSIQSLSSCQPSPQEFEVRYLGFNFGSTPPYSTYHLSNLNNEETVPFQKPTLEQQRSVLLEIFHLDSIEPNSTNLTQNPTKLKNHVNQLNQMKHQTRPTAP